MSGPRIRQYLPAIADLFAEYAAAAMLLWFEAPGARADAEWVTEVQVLRAVDACGVGIARASGASQRFAARIPTDHEVSGSIDDFGSEAVGTRQQGNSRARRMRAERLALIASIAKGTHR